MAAVKKFYAACEAGPAVCLTAWDYPTGLLAKDAGMDLILIGDSLAITALGLPSTTSITLDELIYHARAVSRAAKAGPFLLGDLPLGSYEITPEQAVASALRLVKEGDVDGVKLEGGKEMAPQVAAITKAGVPVVGHIGLTPQRALATLHTEGIEGLSGAGEARLSFGSTLDSAEMVLDDALALQKAGAVAIVMEAVAAPTARMITEVLKVPTIGIGCGGGTSAQIAVQSEVLGYQRTFLQRWHTKYAEVGDVSLQALRKYKEETRGKQFPTEQQGYVMKNGEEKVLVDLKKRAKEMSLYENMGRERRGSKSSSY
ncbi:3-methyl-2-oxobutanoate hydroxymethyltransferase [Cyphellophora europaea CBS 101466]|uniref:3-methyl-2-oxobutanoate hydroxymethyltransferase n=1 Tax=Cyphellophora europaea (strain CBS 101466) TaxID=1220924 RepID=W2RQA0_CYPE1|nr:3-methyl-2-oxobutanoate hydroxymethyltransferase [Cyphellophora europaea CBS 101466]ETN38657.1 3-methyl-2-oxobutanoate hydroxymethyltransferase [Cyphellophora europaea CBS 101466]